MQQMIGLGPDAALRLWERLEQAPTDGSSNSYWKRGECSFLTSETGTNCPYSRIIRVSRFSARRLQSSQDFGAIA